MGYTGLALWSPTAQMPFFAAGVAAVGGAMSMRIIHYFGMFVFIIFMIIHIYMAVAEGGKPLVKLMFCRKEHGGITYDINTHALAGEDHSIKD
jgi:Ni/Fe-hydrogenase 1 B-type cytochrome subunit